MFLISDKLLTSAAQREKLVVQISTLKVRYHDLKCDEVITVVSHNMIS